MNKTEVKHQIQKLVDKYRRIFNEGKLNSYNEAQTRNEFIEPLFEFLGWDMRNLSNDNEVTTEENVSGGRVDLAFRFNNIPVIFLEAKAMKVDLDEWKWAEQAINYSWNKSVTWAILTDFESIKVFNAEIPPTGINQNLFFEIKWNEYIERFEQLWLLSKESFEQKLLDKEAQKWGKLTKRKQVGEKLFEDLMDWRVLLTQEFKKHNELATEDLDEGIQRILDRLIFIRTAEDRKIETNILQNIYRSEKPGAYKHLVSVFREFDDGYNSKLFAQHYCETWKIEDKTIFNVLKGLYETKDGYRYDFSIISADVLGGIYEQYLSFVQGRNAEEKAKSKRKAHGIFYTPKYIVEYIVKETLGEVLKKTKEKDIHKIKVLDPACGSGSFLQAAYDKILENIKSPNLFTKFDILKENIFGVDLDVKAVEIAQLNLLLKILNQKTQLPTLIHNICNGNSLVSGDQETLKKYFGENWREQKPFNFEEKFKEVSAQGGFDVIIGNPPYVYSRGHKFDNVTQFYFRETFKLIQHRVNTYLLFIEKSYKLLKEGGHLGFIVPNTWLTIDTFSKLRKFLLEETSNLQIVNIFDKVFGEASVDTCLLIFKKGKPRNVTLGEFKNGQLIVVGTFPVSQFKNNNYIINIASAKNKGTNNLIENINAKSTHLSNFSTIKVGVQAYTVGEGKPKQTQEMKDKRIYHSNIKVDETWLKYLNGIDVKRYLLDWSGEYIKYGDNLVRKRKPHFFKSPRILVRQIPSKPPYCINSIYIEREYINDINSMVIIDFKVNPFFILPILNSKITSYWFINTFDKFQRKIFPQFKVKELATFPIPNASQAEQEKLAQKARQMLNLHKELQKIAPNTDKYNQLSQEIEKLDRKIDEEVYKLYGLTADEIAIIESNN